MTENRELFFVKLGGSLITDKTRPETPRLEVIERLATEVKQATEDLELPLVVGHGSGSFGHVVADRYRIQEGIDDPEQVAGISATQEQAFKLHWLVISALREAGVAAFSLAPSSFVLAADGTPDQLWPEPLLGALQLGLVPVVFGDVVMDRQRGAAICSTEMLFRALVPALGSRGRFVRRVVWLGETDGVYDAQGETITEISTDDLAAVLGGLEGAAGIDVTGGIRHRLETAGALAEQGIRSWIGDGRRAGALVDGLRGEASHGTLIQPGRLG